VREACGVIGGKGGGRPDAAQGGGTNIAKTQDAIVASRTWALKLVM
jgi:alanyl-tRNA synthetase